MAIKDKITLVSAACVLGVAMAGISAPARADNAGAFIGGVFATKLLGNMSARTQAEQQQAAAAQAQASRPVVVQAPPAGNSAEDKIKELDKMAAGGYITPAEYKAKKKAILDNM